MSKKNRRRLEASRRQEEQRRAKLAAASENSEEDAAEVSEDEASRIRHRAEQKSEYEQRKREKARGSQPLAPFFWGGVIAVAVAVAVGGFLLLSGGSSDAGSSGPSPTPDPRIAGLPIDRTITIEADDDGQSTNPRFVPNTISAEAGEVIEVLVTNVGSVAHNLHFPGLDAAYDTRDDWLAYPGALQPGDTGRVVLKIGDPGSNPFRCDFHPLQHLGTLTLS